MSKLEPYKTKCCSLVNPYLLKGIYIGTIISMRGVTMYAIERFDGQIFFGTRDSIAVLEEETTYGEKGKDTIQQG